MNGFRWWAITGMFFLLTGCTSDAETNSSAPLTADQSLTAPEIPAANGLQSALDERHSVREFTAEPVTRSQLATLLWAAYGTRTDGGRTVPSAGGIYPLTVLFVASDVEGLDPGLYEYAPLTHKIALRKAGDFRADLAAAALGQEPVTNAPLTIVIAGNPDDLRGRYGDRSERYALLEAGHSAQNLSLVVGSLGLGMVTIGAFTDTDVARLLELPGSDSVYYLIPVGYPAAG